MSQSRKYMHFWGALLLLAFFAPGLMAEANGTLCGELTGTVRSQNGERFVEVRDFNDMVRRVVITHAEIEYDASASYDMPSDPASSALVAGTDVQITARMDARSGEWTASRVLVIPHHAARFEEEYGDDGDAPDTVSVEETSPNVRRTI